MKYLIIKCIFALFLNVHVNIVHSCVTLANQTTADQNMEQHIEVDWSTKRLPNEFIVQFTEYLNKETRREYISSALKRFKVIISYQFHPLLC